jgi:hypothetical protein
MARRATYMRDQAREGALGQVVEWRAAAPVSAADNDFALARRRVYRRSGSMEVGRCRIGESAATGWG